LLSLASYALGKLKYVSIVLDKQLEELTDAVFRLMSVSYEDTLQDRYDFGMEKQEEKLKFLFIFRLE